MKRAIIQNNNLNISLCIKLVNKTNQVVEEKLTPRSLVGYIKNKIEAFGKDK